MNGIILALAFLAGLAAMFYAAADLLASRGLASVVLSTAFGNAAIFTAVCFAGLAIVEALTGIRKLLRAGLEEQRAAVAEMRALVRQGDPSAPIAPAVPEPVPAKPRRRPGWIGGLVLALLASAQPANAQPFDWSQRWHDQAWATGHGSTAAEYCGKVASSTRAQVLDEFHAELPAYAGRYGVAYGASLQRAYTKGIADALAGLYANNARLCDAVSAHDIALLEAIANARWRVLRP